MTNLALWNYLRKTNPTFASHTSKGTKETFTERGFEALKRDNIDVINEYFELSMRVVYQKFTGAKVRNPLEDTGLVEVYSTPNGGYVQRMAMKMLKPTTPKFKNLIEGTSVDQQIIRKTEQFERFFPQNFDFQNFVTLHEFPIKTIFINEYGMGEFLAGIVSTLEKSYVQQEYVNTLEALNKMINSTKYPLQESQIVTLDEWTDAATGMPSTAALENFILTAMDIASQMEAVSSTKQLNALKFETAYDPSDFVMLTRVGIKNRIKLALRLGAYNPEDLTIPFTIKEIENFGGLVPKDANDDTMQEVYDQFGAVIGYIDAAATVNGAAFKNSAGQWLVNITSGGTTADTTFPFEPDHWEDPNEDIIAVIAQKGCIFKNIQNGLIVRPAPYNSAGLYQDIWMSSPNNAIVCDPLYAMIVIKKKTS